MTGINFRYLPLKFVSFLRSYEIILYLCERINKLKYSNTMKKNLILSVLFLLAIFASCSKETTYSITNATGSLIAVRVHEYDDKDKPIKIQEETVLSTSPITFIAHEKAETIKIYITKALSQYGTWINENLWIQQVYYLDDTQSITIDGNTIVGNVEP